MAMSMIEYRSTISGTGDFRISGFFDGWKKPLSSEALRRLLENSAYRVIAVDSERKAIVGIITALSDEVNWAFIPYLEVLPEYSGLGIGRQLVEAMLSQLEHLSCVDLTCDADLQPFYARFGMLESRGMVIRRYQ